LSALFIWRNKIGRDEFIRTWENSLAFRGQQVKVLTDSLPPIIGELVGLEPNGNLQIRRLDGILHLVQFGEIHLRPAL